MNASADVRFNHQEKPVREAEILNPTENYLNENRRVLSLEKRELLCPKPREIPCWSVRKLWENHVRTAISCAKWYPRAVWDGRRHLAKTWRLKNSMGHKRALVIGNGPSQGYLDVDTLDRFVENGGETYCVNHWNINDKLSKHTPSWMFFSDPNTFDPNNKNSSELRKYLELNQTTRVAVPSLGYIKKFNLKISDERIFMFIDCEMSAWGNINPLFPRGYLSMTLYKALAWAIHLGYAEIGIIGMDNTYPRNIYCDKDNRVINLETHCGAEDYIVDQSQMYPTVASLLGDISRLFYHLEYFPRTGVFNLDQYSLTDRFEKVDPITFFGLT